MKRAILLLALCMAGVLTLSGCVTGQPSSPQTTEIPGSQQIGRLVLYSETNAEENLYVSILNHDIGLAPRHVMKIDVVLNTNSFYGIIFTLTDAGTDLFAALPQENGRFLLYFDNDVVIDGHLVISESGDQFLIDGSYLNKEEADYIVAYLSAELWGTEPPTYNPLRSKSVDSSIIEDPINSESQEIDQSIEPEPDVAAPKAPMIGDIIQFGGYDWRVLDMQDGRALIMSEKVIGDRYYHNELMDITWAESDTRQFLNGEFFNSFSVGDRAKIIQVTNINLDNQWYGTPGGNDTDDYVFLLSLEEVVRYFGDSSELSNKPPDEDYIYWISDKYNDDRRARYLNNSWGAWLLRSPGGNGVCVTAVRLDGIISVYGIEFNLFRYAIRPAMWIQSP